MDEVLLAHDFALMFGGRAGVRDFGSIEAAIARPYSGYYRSITRKAAALLHSLATNHGFIDGNKRTALYMTALLLARSGYKLRDNDQDLLNREIEELVLAVVEHRMSFEDIAAWFKARLVKL